MCCLYLGISIELTRVANPEQVGATQTRLGVVRPQVDVRQALSIYGCVNCVVTIVLEVGWIDEEPNANAPLL